MACIVRDDCHRQVADSTNSGVRYLEWSYHTMTDHFDAKKDNLVGKAKEEFGKATDDESTEAEGKFDQSKGDAKEGVADLKDKAKDGLNDVKDKANDIAGKIKGDDKK